MMAVWAREDKFNVEGQVLLRGGCQYELETRSDGSVVIRYETGGVQPVGYYTEYNIFIPTYMYQVLFGEYEEGLHDAN